jgi:hypothetical protein
MAALKDKYVLRVEDHDTRIAIVLYTMSDELPDRQPLTFDTRYAAQEAIASALDMVLHSAARLVVS